MGPNSIQTGGSASVNYANEPTVVDVSIPAPQGQNAQQLEELLQAMDALDGARTRSATQGVTEPDTDTKVDASGMLASLDGAEANVSADIYAFMALFTQMAQQMRKAAKEQRQTELQNQVSSINSAADKMVEAAEKRFAAAVVQGSMQIASGAISVGSGVTSLGATATANPKTDFTSGSQFLTELNAKQSMAQGSAQMVTGLGSIISGGIEYGASLDDADAKRLEADGTAAQARRENAQEVAQNMADMIKDIREQLRAIVQSNIETNRGMARNI